MQYKNTYCRRRREYMRALGFILKRTALKLLLRTTASRRWTMRQNTRPIFILLDIMLPKLDGWQVCREIRKSSDVPIIMLTAKGRDL